MRSDARKRLTERPCCDAAAKVERVRELHGRIVLPPHHQPQQHGVCQACLAEWPCSTIVALNGGTVATPRDYLRAALDGDS